MNHECKKSIEQVTRGIKIFHHLSLQPFIETFVTLPKNLSYIYIYIIQADFSIVHHAASNIQNCNINCGTPVAIHEFW
jgi:hypothetical protein